MDKAKVYEFLQQHKPAVVSTVSTDGKPEAALIGVAISEDLQIVFDILNTSRKYKNISQNPNVAIVIGWDNETTIQYEGVATELNGADAEYYKEIYFEVYKYGRERAKTWPDIVHFKITPKWIRYSDFNESGRVEEILF